LGGRPSRRCNALHEIGEQASSQASADSPPIVPPDDGLDIPPEFRRTDAEKQYEAFKCRWVQYCETDFAALPAAMQTKFASELLGKAVIATGKGEGPR